MVGKVSFLASYVAGLIHPPPFKLRSIPPSTFLVKSMKSGNGQLLSNIIDVNLIHPVGSSIFCCLSTNENDVLKANLLRTMDTKTIFTCQQET